MKWPVTRSQMLSKFRPKRYTSVVMMLIIWAGVAGSLFAGISTDLTNRDFLKGRAVTIADTLPVSEITALHGNTSDSNTTAYRELKDRLERVRNDQSDLRFADLIGMRNGQAFIYVDSEAPSTNGYTPPGENYSEASRPLKDGFSASEPFLVGPTRDRWGLWMSAYAPIKDNHTNQTIAVVGIDVSAVHYFEHVALYALIPLILSAIPLAGLIRDRRLESKEHEIGELKKQFVSIASHELRSPLNGMLWAVQSLMRSDQSMTKEQQEMLRDMYQSTESSISTVNEILDLSIFERGQANKLQREVVDLITVMKQVTATLKLGADEKKIGIKMTGEWPDRILTLGDVGALKRGFMNLVSNAIKYSHADSKVEISYRLSNHEHIIAIRDRGIGIPTDEQAKVLGGYYRATNAAQLQAHGTGLGLWLARMLAEQHGGRLWLHSQVNHGTTIYMALPVYTMPLPATAKQ